MKLKNKNRFYKLSYFLRKLYSLKLLSFFLSENFLRKNRLLSKQTNHIVDIGTGIGIFIPTIPIFALFEKVLPESPSLVKMLTPFPNS